MTDFSHGTAVTLVGPTHPYTGGIAQHTTRLALELEARGYLVTVESWKAQYPKRLYPGTSKVPDGKPEIGLASHVIERLTWYNPVTWWAAGWRGRRSSLLAVSIPTPLHAIPYLVMLSASVRSAPTVGIVHNVLPHEPGPFDRFLMQALLARLERIIVHGKPAREAAISLGVPPSKILERSLPSPWLGPETPTPEPAPIKGPLRALFFGTVRRYKGLDILLKALSKTHGVELTVAGEFWDDEDLYLDLIRRLGITNRVAIHRGYIVQSDFPRLFAGADILVLPYRSGSSSIVREVAFRFGLPIIASSVGSIADGIDDGINGRIIPAGDVQALSDALMESSDRRVLSRWSRAARSSGARQSELWDRYIEALAGIVSGRAKGTPRE